MHGSDLRSRVSRGMRAIRCWETCSIRLLLPVACWPPPTISSHHPTLPQTQPFLLITHTDHNTHVHFANWTLQATPLLLASEIIATHTQPIIEAEVPNLSALHHAPQSIG